MGTRTFLSLGEQIYQTLKERIVNNQYMPGTVLQIDKLAEELGVSSTPIRETLFKLDGMGLVTMIRNKGAVVSEIDERMVRDIWQFRTLLETFTAKEALLHVDSSNLQNLKDKISYLIDYPNDFELYKETDVWLHNMLNCSNNSLVKDALKNLNDHSRRIRYFAESTPFRSEIVVQVSREHLRILEALSAQDAESVLIAVKTHLENALERTMKALVEIRQTIETEKNDIK